MFSDISYSYAIDLSDTVKSWVRLFADECSLYTVINNIIDHAILQQHLNVLEDWAQSRGMRFNAKRVLHYE